MYIVFCWTNIGYPCVLLRCTPISGYRCFLTEYDMDDSPCVIQVMHPLQCLSLILLGNDNLVVGMLLEKPLSFFPESWDTAFLEYNDKAPEVLTAMIKDLFTGV